MTEISPKLMLKRKKSPSDLELPSTRKLPSFIPESVSDFLQSGGSEPPTTFAPTPASTSASASSPAPACSGADGLWAMTLRWILQETQDTAGLVAELPPLSAVTPPPCSAAADWKITDEVPPFPEYSFLQTCLDHISDSQEPHRDTPQPSLSPKPHLSPLQMQTLLDSQKDRHRETQGTKTTVRTSGQKSAESGGLTPSCPICLLVFPLGFTQLDRDSHLALCLSEVKIDVTW